MLEEEMEDEEAFEETKFDELICEINSADKEIELSPLTEKNIDQNTLYAINHECNLNSQYR